MPLFSRRPTPGPDDDLDIADALLQGHDMMVRTGQAHRARWALGSALRWDLDPEAGVLRWTFDDRTAEAPVQVLGSHSTTGRSWLWAWADDSVPPDLRTASETVRAWGEAHGHASLTAPRIDGVDEEPAGDLAAIAFRLSRATGWYRAPAGNTRLYLTFGPVTLTTDDGERSTFTLDVS